MRFADCKGQGRAVRQQNCAANVKDSNQPVNIVKKDRMMSSDKKIKNCILAKWSCFIIKVKKFKLIHL